MNLVPNTATNSKKSRGQFFTRGNPFRYTPFRQWATQSGLPHKKLLEPFAGANHLVDSLRSEGYCEKFYACDIDPAHEDVVARNTLLDFPTGFEVCVTNPPWLSKNSATRNGYTYPAKKHDDLYKHCLELCLRHCTYVAALVPASYLQCGLFFERLQSCILLHHSLFTDTENPVCLALFGNQLFTPINLYDDDVSIGTLEQLQNYLPSQNKPTTSSKNLRFNDPSGELGFISFDNTKMPSIRFCHAEQLQDYAIKESSRFITRISGNFGDADMDNTIQQLNNHLNQFRRNTHDVFLTPFKGIRKDGKYRRRMKFTLARQFIDAYQPA